MYNLDDIIRLYFRETTAKEVINDDVVFSEYPLNTFCSKAMMSMKYYSDTENIGLYNYAKGNNSNSNTKRNDRYTDVFMALAELSSKLLIIQNNRVVCRYSKFVRWRRITTSVDETSLICSFLAQRSACGYEEYTKFLWDVALGHNNVQLNKLMQEGLAENHFHLYGSAPIFHLTWLRLMNNVMDNRNISSLRQIEVSRRMSHSYNSVKGVKDDLVCEHLQAAFLRCILMLVLLEKENRMQSSAMLSRYGYSIGKIEYLLKNPMLLLDERSNIQAMIMELKDCTVMNQDMCDDDYALYGPEYSADASEMVNAIFSGERWIIYNIMKDYYKDTSFDPVIYKWLYTYLLIKVDMRAEIQQVNGNIGFENFSIYTKRKSGFLYGGEAKENMARYAVYGNLQTGNIRSLEIRLTPEDTACDNAKLILRHENMLKERRLDGDTPQKEWFYYVFHFTKTADKACDEEDCFEVTCRHEQKRKRCEIQANGIIAFRNTYPKLASRVLGIDACSQEIGCRPEVFATVFRKLGQHICDPGLECEVQQLKKTYHVGEDFLDIVDGLRAVDECVRFLDFQCGDRIGHGTVLGINVRKWYDIKRNTIIISKQDYLDNVAWLYNKLIEFRIDGWNNLKIYLEKEFHKYFSEIYLMSGMPEMERFQFDIYNYYDAWKLRGDNPKIYVDGKYDENLVWEESEGLIENWHNENKKIRKRAECVWLYYCYHYSWKVRIKGAEIQEIFVPPYYVDGIIEVQKAMRNYINIKGIGIETNPTSNFLISTMSDYSEHPILKFYNKDLTVQPDELKECPQMYVSINTDDKGIFHTSIENEYAYLACALEELKDKDGCPRYSRQMIYQWLDNIRIMGLRQSFFENTKEDLR